MTPTVSPPGEGPVTTAPEPRLPALGAEAVGRTDAAGGYDDDGRDFPCPRCGADLVYAIGELSLHCGHCRFESPVDLDDEEPVEEKDYRAGLALLEEQREQRSGEASAEAVLDETVHCEACSAEVTFEGSVTSLECGYCGTPLQRDHVHLDPDRLPVDGVLPFAVDHDGAQRSLTRWVEGLWFAPSAFKRRGLRGEFRGVYLPFWTFDSLTFTRYSGQRGDHYTTGSGKRRRRRTRWRRVRGRFQQFFDDVLVLAARGVRSTPLGPMLRHLEPWPMKDLQPFRPEFLAGFQARTYDTRLEEGFTDAHDRMESELRAEVRRRIGGDVQRIEAMSTRFDAIRYKHVLLPLWLMTYRHGGRDMQVVINAITGRVHGHRPWSVVKIVLAILVAALVVLVFRLLAG